MFPLASRGAFASTCDLSPITHSVFPTVTFIAYWMHAFPFVPILSFLRRPPSSRLRPIEISKISYVLTKTCFEQASSMPTRPRFTDIVSHSSPLLRHWFRTRTPPFSTVDLASIGVVSLLSHDHECLSIECLSDHSIRPVLMIR